MSHPKFVSISLSLPEKSLVQLEAAAQSEGVSVDNLTREIIERWLKGRKSQGRKQAKIPWAPMDDYLPS